MIEEKGLGKCIYAVIWLRQDRKISLYAVITSFISSVFGHVKMDWITNKRCGAKIKTANLPVFFVFFLSFFNFSSFF